MKLLNKQIDMISWTSKEGVVTPVRFRMEEDGKSIVIRIGRILQTEKNMFGGTPTLSFRCASEICGQERIYEVTYNSGSQKWLLKIIEIRALCFCMKCVSSLVNKFFLRNIVIPQFCQFHRKCVSLTQFL